MRVLVTGGRHYKDRQSVFMALDSLHAHKSIAAIINGAAPGADSLAIDWAIARGVTVISIPADWNKHGNAAGPIRNQRMILEMPDLVLAFPGGKGTRDMVARAKLAKIPVIYPQSSAQEPDKRAALH